MDLSRFPRRRYSDGPTPLEFLPHLTRALGGPEIWIKRDDLLGLSPGGNKTRKLEFLVADALQQGCDTLITCGAVQSNHCRLALSAAVKEGLRCRFVIEERVPGSFREDANGNHFLFRLLGVEDLKVVPAGSDLLAAMAEVAQELAASGRKGYVIPTGGSNALGGLGYVACAQELQQQCFQQQVAFDAIVVASGSSGTHGGLLAAVLGDRMRIEVVGIGISREPQQQVPLVQGETQAVLDLLGAGITVQPEQICCVGGFWQPRYSVPNARMVEAVQLLARTEAILLDPVYTGKAMAGLIGLCRQGRFRRGQRVLFLHTGGAPALFAYTDAVSGRQQLAP
ncbi:MAG: D-cysteine desulfhydrase [Planctomycetes bacterium]|nr:D-cysteine desulfhydrase [Planctomycetota bacterium]